MKIFKFNTISFSKLQFFWLNLNDAGVENDRSIKPT